MWEREGGREREGSEYPLLKQKVGPYGSTFCFKEREGFEPSVL